MILVRPVHSTMQFTTGLFDSLFGEKVTIELPGPDGAVLKRTVTKKWLEEMQRRGKISEITRSTVRVHVLDPIGYRVRHWVVGEDVDEQQCERFRDPVTRDLYMMSFFKDGQPEETLLLKHAWDQAKEQMDAAGRLPDAPPQF